MKFTEAQLEAAIIEPGEPKGSNDELLVMSHEYFNNLSNPVKLSGYAGNISQAFKSGQRSRHQSRQMARFPSSKRRQITNRAKNHDTLSRFGVMQAALRLIATAVTGVRSMICFRSLFREHTLTTRPSMV